MKNRIYLAIYDSFYNHEKKETAHKCYKSLGSVETLRKNGIEDPVSHFQEEVEKLNKFTSQKVWYRSVKREQLHA